MARLAPGFAQGAVQKVQFRENEAVLPLPLRGLAIVRAPASHRALLSLGREGPGRRLFLKAVVQRKNGGGGPGPTASLEASLGDAAHRIPACQPSPWATPGALGFDWRKLAFPCSAI
jgi:hypothetical protein